MPVLDENGDLFGRVNAVDALAVVFVVVILLVAGIVGATAFRSDPAPVLTQVVEVQADGVSAATAEGIETGPVAKPGIVAVENVSVVSEDGNRTVSLWVQLHVQYTAEGLVEYEGERLYIGRELTLDLDSAAITGVVVDAAEPVENAATPPVSPIQSPSPTPSPTPSPMPSPSPTPPPSDLATPEPLETTTQSVIVAAVVSESVVDSLKSGPVGTDDIIEVRSFSTMNNDGLVRLKLTVVLRVQASSDAVFYRGVELVDGQQLVLELDNATIRGTVREV